MGSHTVNPVLTVLGLAVTAFCSTGVWVFASAFLTRKADTKIKDVDAVTDLESASREYRREVSAERDTAKRKLTVFASVVIPLLRTIDSFLPRIVECISPEDMSTVRAQADAVWKAIEP